MPSEIARNTPLGFSVGDDDHGMTYDDMKNRVMGELKKVFRPEFLNRIDEVIVFHKLQKDEIKQIVDLLLRRIRESLAERDLQLELTEGAEDFLVEKGWDPSMGARPLRRAIQRYIEDPLADFVLRAELVEGGTVLVEPAEEGAEDQDVRLSIVKPEPKPTPVGVGAEGGKEGEAAESVDDGGALDQPPVLPAGFGHLLGNTIPFLILGGAIALGGLARTAAVVAIVALVGGAGTWLVG